MAILTVAATVLVQIQGGAVSRWSPQALLIAVVLLGVVAIAWIAGGRERLEVAEFAGDDARLDAQIRRRVHELAVEEPRGVLIVAGGLDAEGAGLPSAVTELAETAKPYGPVAAALVRLVGYLHPAAAYRLTGAMHDKTAVTVELRLGRRLVGTYTFDAACTDLVHSLAGWTLVAVLIDQRGKDEVERLPGLEGVRDPSTFAFQLAGAAAQIGGSLESALRLYGRALAGEGQSVAAGYGYAVARYQRDLQAADTDATRVNVHCQAASFFFRVLLDVDVLRDGARERPMWHRLLYAYVAVTLNLVAERLRSPQTDIPVCYAEKALDIAPRLFAEPREASESVQALRRQLRPRLKQLDENNAANLVPTVKLLGRPNEPWQIDLDRSPECSLMRIERAVDQLDQGSPRARYNLACAAGWLHLHVSHPSNAESDRTDIARRAATLRDRLLAEVKAMNAALAKAGTADPFLRPLTPPPNRGSTDYAES